MKKLIIASIMLAAACAPALASDEITDLEKKIATLHTTIAVCTRSNLVTDQWILDAGVIGALVSHDLTSENEDHIKRLDLYLLEKYQGDEAAACRRNKPLVDRTIEAFKSNPKLNEAFKQ